MTGSPAKPRQSHSRSKKITMPRMLRRASQRQRLNLFGRVWHEVTASAAAAPAAAPSASSGGGY
jgi:hypothetical protein